MNKAALFALTLMCIPKISLATEGNVVPPIFKVNDELREQLENDPEAGRANKNLISTSSKDAETGAPIATQHLNSGFLIFEVPDAKYLIIYHGFASAGTNGELISVEYGEEGRSGAWPPHKFSITEKTKDAYGVSSLTKNCNKIKTIKASSIIKNLPGNIHKLACSSAFSVDDDPKMASKTNYYYSDYLDLNILQLPENSNKSGLPELTVHFKTQSGVTDSAKIRTSLVAF